MYPVRVEWINNRQARLIEPADRKRLSKWLSYNYAFWYEGRDGMVRKQRVKSLIGRNGEISAGFVPYIQQRFAVEFETPPGDFPTFREDWAQKVINERPYQLEALRAVANAEFPRGMILMPTGTGKTVVAAMILAAAPKQRALFVVHTKDLLDQTVEEFETMLGRPIGVIGAGRRDFGFRTVGMIQSLDKTKYRRDAFDIIMIDEAHHAPADMYADLLDYYDAPVRLGFTGTERPDEAGWLLGTGLLGPPLYEYSYQQAVADGWLAQCRVRFLDPEVSLEAAQAKGGYRAVYEAGIINHEDRNQLIAAEALAFAQRDKSVLVQVKEIPHGEILSQMIGPAAWIHGGTHKDDRSAVKAAMKAGRLKIVICSPIWDEGVDIPNLDAIIVAGGGMSEIKSVQKVGRGLRPHEDKDWVEVVDFNDYSHKHLRKHSRARAKIYKGRGWEVTNTMPRHGRPKRSPGSRLSRRPRSKPIMVS